jgi:acyl carrier protein phosphodiesterase
VNYLAHFYLAQPDKDLIFGNYIGDGVRGSKLVQFAEPVQRGIRFHRFIDSFTDAHELVLEAKSMFYPTQSKFSGVVVDVLFDHLLATNWQTYSNEYLNQFAQRCYAVIDDHNGVMPVRSERFYRYMVSNNILEQYQHREGIRKVLLGMDSRTKFSSNMAESVDVLDEVSSDLNRIFQGFFPELKRECERWRAEN